MALPSKLYGALAGLFKFVNKPNDELAQYTSHIMANKPSEFSANMTFLLGNMSAVVLELRPLFDPLHVLHSEMIDAEELLAK
jgi:hypothetical protein